MTDEQTNETLAKLIGWKCRLSPVLWTMPDGRTAQTAPDPRFRELVVMTLFSTSRDAFHEHIVPVLEERGLMNKWAEKVCELCGSPPFETTWLDGKPIEHDATDYAGVALALDAPPRTLCEAAIAVLKGNSDDGP